MTAWTESSDAAREVAFLVLDRALDSLDDSGPMIPFAVVGSGEVLRLHRFVAETLEEGIDQGRAWLAQLPLEVDRAALAFDGYLTKDGDRFDAIYVEVHERGAVASVAIAQCYVPGPAPVEAIGNPAVVGDRAPLLGSG